MIATTGRSKLLAPVLLPVAVDNAHSFRRDITQTQCEIPIWVSLDRKDSCYFVVSFFTSFSVPCWCHGKNGSVQLGKTHSNVMILFGISADPHAFYINGSTEITSLMGMQALGCPQTVQLH